MRLAFSTRHIFVLAILAAGCSSSQSSPSPAGESDDPQAKALTNLQETGEHAWQFTAHSPSLTHLAGRSAPLLTNGRSGHQATLAFLSEHSGLYKMIDPANELQLVREEGDELGNTHVRLQQVVGGIPVRGAEMIAHFDRTGALTSLDASYVAGLSAIQRTAALLPDHAHAAALSDLQKDVQDLRGEPAAQTAPALKIFAPEDGPARLAYHVRLRGDAETRPVLMDYMIDAQTGAVLQKYDDIETATATGTGIKGTTRTLQVTANGTNLQLIDTTRAAAGIKTYTASQGSTTPGTVVSGKDGAFDTANPAAGSAVDAHYFAGVVYDFYKTSMGRLGIDGQDSAIISTVHYGQKYDNAFWDGTQMVYGDGDGTQFGGFAAGLDVVGHELTHGVTQSTSNLQYTKQSGALNEAVSDIMGAIIEHSNKPDPKLNWMLGEDLSLNGSAFRDMIHPKNGQQPASMSQYVNTTTDNGGVHTNSGIVNNAMYLMTMGGTNDGTNISVAFGIGWDKAAKLWYTSDAKYFTSTTNFAGAATGTLSAAKDLQFTQNEQNIVECAWIATGVMTGTCKTIVSDTAPPDAGAPPATTGGGSTTPPSTGGTGTGGGTGAGTGGGKTAPPAGTPQKGGSQVAPSQSDNSNDSQEFTQQTKRGCSSAPGAPGDTGVLVLLAAGAAIFVRRRRSA